MGRAPVSEALVELVHSGLELLRQEIQGWNDRALEHGALSAPYEEETEDLDIMIRRGLDELSDEQNDMITIHDISIGSARYIKAGLVLAMTRREGEIL